MEKNAIISSDFLTNIEQLHKILNIKQNFDIIYKDMEIGEREAGFFFMNGFINSEVMQKLMSNLEEVTKEDMGSDVEVFAKRCMTHMSVDLEDKLDKILQKILSGVVCLFIQGYDKAILVDCRTYPARGVGEPETDKVLRGSRDGFVETVVFNTALIRRRIRNPMLTHEIFTIGRTSRTDVVLCYMNDRVNKQFLTHLRKELDAVNIDSLTMNQESLAECLFKRGWHNPFPKFKFTERPDAATASILEGNVVILVDNSPSAMIVPTSIFDILEEADDYYFPPITGTYLRLARFLITFTSVILTPTWILLIQYPQWLPDRLNFILPQGNIQVPIIFQLFLLEFAIDGLRLAAVNTPNMLSMPLSVVAGIVMGDYAVQSGWFNAETMLYMAFVVLANYSQPSFEFGFALKFMRMITLLLTAIFGVWGYVAGHMITLLCIACNKTISGKSYIYPLIPFNLKQCLRRFVRITLPKTEK